MRINKNGEETPKIYLTCCNLLIAQGSWQAYYQIFSIILLKEFIELNEHDDKKCKINPNICVVTKVINIKLMEN